MVAKAAEQSNQTKKEFLAELDIARDIIKRSDVGLWLTIFVMVVCVLLMAGVHFPHISSGLRWPGITLLLSGLVFLIGGLVTKSRLLDDLQLEDVPPIPPSLVEIINDVSRSMATDVANGILTLSITIMVVGFVMVVASVGIRLLHIPFFSR